MVRCCEERRQIVFLDANVDGLFHQQCWVSCDRQKHVGVFSEAALRTWQVDNSNVHMLWLPMAPVSLLAMVCFLYSIEKHPMCTESECPEIKQKHWEVWELVSNISPEFVSPDTFMQIDNNLQIADWRRNHDFMASSKAFLSSQRPIWDQYAST